MRFYGHSDEGEVELPISDEVIEFPVSALHDWAGKLIATAVLDLNLNPALPLGVAGGSLTGELSEAWMLVNVALRDAARDLLDTAKARLADS